MSVVYSKKRQYVLKHLLWSEGLYRINCTSVLAVSNTSLGVIEETTKGFIKETVDIVKGEEGLVVVDRHDEYDE